MMTFQWLIELFEGEVKASFARGASCSMLKWVMVGARGGLGKLALPGRGPTMRGLTSFGYTFDTLARRPKKLSDPHLNSIHGYR